MLAYFPLKQDGFIANEVEGRAVPVHTQSVLLADFNDDVRAASRFLIDCEMRGPIRHRLAESPLRPIRPASSEGRDDG